MEDDENRYVYTEGADRHQELKEEENEDPEHYFDVNFHNFDMNQSRSERENLGAIEHLEYTDTGIMVFEVGPNFGNWDFGRARRVES